MNDFLERTLEDIVFENQSGATERGFTTFYKKAQRQFKLPSGKIIDILTWEIIDNILYARIIEFKRDKLFDDALWQIAGYFSELIQCILGNYKEYKIECILCGTEISENIHNAVLLNMEVSVYLYSYGFNGIKFRHHDFTMNKVRSITDFHPDEGTPEFCDRLNNPTL